MEIGSKGKSHPGKQDTLFLHPALPSRTQSELQRSLEGVSPLNLVSGCGGCALEEQEGEGRNCLLEVGLALLASLGVLQKQGVSPGPPESPPS